MPDHWLSLGHWKEGGREGGGEGRGGRGERGREMMGQVSGTRLPFRQLQSKVVDKLTLTSAFPTAVSASEKEAAEGQWVSRHRQLVCRYACTSCML